MRIPAVQQRNLGRSAATSNPRPSHANPGGTMGGPSLMGNGARPTAGTARPGRRQVMLGNEVYLWVLVFIEVGLIGWLRQKFRRHHGG